jgi:hypothetical protein
MSDMRRIYETRIGGVNTSTKKVDLSYEEFAKFDKFTIFPSGESARQANYRAKTGCFLRFQTA